MNQTAATGLYGNRANFTYVLWNTKADGTGTNIEDYGKITGPVIFYAIYYQSDYYYTGAPQTYRVPVTGWYKVQLWGAKGGNDTGTGGKGAYVSGEIHLEAGTNLYVYVGAPGRDNVTGTGAGYNGGANPGSSGWSGAGGGATDIRTVYGNWNQNLNSRIAVAAGGGGGGANGNGGYGGALVGGSGTGGSGGTQTSAGNGDAGGGSSYLSGFDGCVTSYTGYTFRNGDMLAGNQTMPTPEGGTEVGHSGACRARIQLISVD